MCKYVYAFNTVLWITTLIFRTYSKYNLYTKKNKKFCLFLLFSCSCNTEVQASHKGLTFEQGREQEIGRMMEFFSPTHSFER